MIVPLHSSLGDRVRLPLKIKKQTNKTNKEIKIGVVFDFSSANSNVTVEKKLF